MPRYKIVCQSGAILYFSNFHKAMGWLADENNFAVAKSLYDNDTEIAQFLMEDLDYGLRKEAKRPAETLETAIYAASGP